MRADKKSAGGRIRFVAVEAIGRVRLVELTGTETAFSTATIDGELIAKAPAVIRRLPYTLRVRVPR